MLAKQLRASGNFVLILVIDESIIRPQCGQFGCGELPAADDWRCSSFLAQKFWTSEAPQIPSDSASDELRQTDFTATELYDGQQQKTLLAE